MCVCRTQGPLGAARNGVSALGRTFASIRSRITSSGHSELSRTDVATDQGAVELTACSSFSPKLPTPTTQRDGAEAGDITVTVEAALPAGWTEHADNVSGRMYYTNDSTGESSWTYPGTLL